MGVTDGDHDRMYALDEGEIVATASMFPVPLTWKGDLCLCFRVLEVE